MTFTATWMDLEIIILCEVNQIEKDKYHMIAHMWNLKNYKTEPIYKTEIEPIVMEYLDYLIKQ